MTAAGLWLLAAPASVGLAQQRAFEEVVRDLHSPDTGARLEALRLLRESRYPEAVEPVAPLLNDPIDRVQLEALATELSLLLGQRLTFRKKVALVVEVRNGSVAQGAFESGSAAAVLYAVPPDVIRRMASASLDDNLRVRLEMTYGLGVLASPPAERPVVDALMVGLASESPELRAASAAVVGRLRVGGAGGALITLMNDREDAVQAAAMTALGELRDVRAIQALGERLGYHKRGRLAEAALAGLARIAHPSSLPLFQSLLSHQDWPMRMLAAEAIGRVGDRSVTAELETASTAERSEFVRLALAFAVVTLGQPAHLNRVVDGLRDPRTGAIARRYLLELGPPVARTLQSHLADRDPALRAGIVDVLGGIGDRSTIGVLEPLVQDPDPALAAAAQRAIDRLKAHGPSP